ncbi:hypothetical protein SUFG_00034 [Sulfitobacter phage phiCB2047-B]|uniref:Uncharacterized protein n=1 Tax=Sulfitobacter phage phiCB2047-B TaxID=754046 RepID=M4PMS3_9CAUD|nr:hypothetical protein SUFG_00034 [Sulfitobacter phage phiCB2047-B]AGH07402.1 hypothetical protein SUFG_00034 [Sulfitobacter phage phiCB2047-B]
MNRPDLDDMVFVFGSNLSGIHGAGAARYAATNRSAVLGVGEGPTGSCYALPTKGKNISFMPLDTIEKHVNNFLVYAMGNPHQTFQVTQVGCGLGGWTPYEIAPLFLKAPDNCYFDTKWKPILGEDFNYWGTL